jgi:hypothetical protein
MRDGVPYTKSYLHYSDIERGRTFIFGMDAQPNPRFGYKPDDRPVAAVEKTIVENPWIVVPAADFAAFTRVEIGAADKTYGIWYQIVPEGSVAGGEFKRYERPFTVSRNCTVYAYCTDDAGNRSFTTEATLHRVENNDKTTTR